MKRAHQLFLNNQINTPTAEAVARSGEFSHTLLLERLDDFVQRGTALFRTVVR